MSVYRCDECLVATTGPHWRLNYFDEPILENEHDKWPDCPECNKELKAAKMAFLTSDYRVIAE